MFINVVNCRPLQEVKDTIELMPGSSEEFTFQRPGSSIILDSNDGDPSNNTYILLHQNHLTGELEEVSQQQGYKFTISDMQLNTSGVYCVQKQYVREDKKRCCIRISGV